MFVNPDKTKLSFALQLAGGGVMPATVWRSGAVAAPGREGGSGAGPPCWAVHCRPHCAGSAALLWRPMCWLPTSSVVLPRSRRGHIREMVRPSAQHEQPRAAGGLHAVGGCLSVCWGVASRGWAAAALRLSMHTASSCTAFQETSPTGAPACPPSLCPASPSPSRRRYSGEHISVSLTLPLRSRPGAQLAPRLCHYLRPKIHPLLLDATINSPLTVRLNIFQVGATRRVSSHAAAAPRLPQGTLALVCSSGQDGVSCPPCGLPRPRGRAMSQPCPPTSLLALPWLARIPTACLPFCVQAFLLGAMKLHCYVAALPAAPAPGSRVLLEAIETGGRDLGAPARVLVGWCALARRCGGMVAGGVSQPCRGRADG